jgi:hypothetical protein
MDRLLRASSNRMERIVFNAYDRMDGSQLGSFCVFNIF